MNKTSISICVFNQEPELLFNTIDYFITNNYFVLVYFNSIPFANPYDTSECVFIGDGVNVGVATAFNLLLRESIDLGFSYTVLLDHDSIIKVETIESFENLFNENVFIVHPQFYNLIKEEYSGIFVDSLLYPRLLHKNSGTVYSSQCISSGSMVNLKLVGTVGFLRDDFFIDWVDFEWCWRARNKGYLIVGCFSHVMNHSLGDSVSTFFLLSFSKRSLLRYKYILRNGIYCVFHLKNISFRLRLGIFLKIISYFIIYLCDVIFNNPRGVFSLLKSLLLGLLGKLGKIGTTL